MLVEWGVYFIIVAILEQQLYTLAGKTKTLTALLREYDQGMRHAVTVLFVFLELAVTQMGHPQVL